MSFNSDIEASLMSISVAQNWALPKCDGVTSVALSGSPPSRGKITNFDEQHMGPLYLRLTSWE